MLRFCWIGVLQLMVCIFNKVWYMCKACAVVVIPFQADAAVEGSNVVDCVFIVRFDTINQVLFVILGEVFHSKVIDNKGERCGSGGMCPKTWSDPTGFITSGLQVFN